MQKHPALSCTLGSIGEVESGGGTANYLYDLSLRQARADFASYATLARALRLVAGASNPELTLRTDTT